MKRLPFLLSLFVAAVASAGEPPVKDGLVLWLDAAAQPAAARAASLPVLAPLQPVDIFVDGGSSARQAVQPVAERRPIFISDGETAYLKFDGKDDFLAVGGARQLAPAVTVFVLAAPKANAGGFSAMFGTAEAANDHERPEPRLSALRKRQASAC